MNYYNYHKRNKKQKRWVHDQGTTVTCQCFILEVITVLS